MSKELPIVIPTYFELRDALEKTEDITDASKARGFVLYGDFIEQYCLLCRFPGCAKIDDAPYHEHKNHAYHHVKVLANDAKSTLKQIPEYLGGTKK